MKALFIALALIAWITPPAFARPLAQTSQYSQKTLLKNWALSICLAQVAQDERTAQDAASTAGAYLEFGHQDLVVYEQIRALVAKYVALQYGGSVPSEFKTMKCIDLFHSKELDQLTARATVKKSKQ
ncbi:MULTISPECIES: T6SS amidase immunity protein Tai4 family protein [unclassified Acidovorax]|uniref:T6SS amidase immunity protein Tai4 family protein n=1 Tax=unclassified Acidovorax TaxID=2684926 RepID=UPI0009E91D97|nr:MULTISPECIES: T6SS amidase immunity protein Tai4 family protein [unclassified Acidovorax]